MECGTDESEVALEIETDCNLLAPELVMDLELPPVTEGS